MSATHVKPHSPPKEPASDLRNEKGTGRSEAKKPYKQILQEEVIAGMRELRRPAVSLFLSGLSAGLDVGFSLLLMATMLALAGNTLSKPVVEILVANVYAVGILFVVLGRSELFTEQKQGVTMDDYGRFLLWSTIGSALGGVVFVGLVKFSHVSLGSPEKHSQK